MSAPYREPAMWTQDPLREAQAELLREIAVGVRIANARWRNEDIFTSDYNAALAQLRALHDSVMGNPS